MARHCLAGRAQAGRGDVRQGFSNTLGKAWQGRAGQGKEFKDNPGMERRCDARQCAVRIGKARNSKHTRPGVAKRGWALHGRAGDGKAR